MDVLSYWEHWLMRIQHRMICQPSCRISAVKVREGRRRKTEKNVKRGNKSNIELKLSNFTYHGNCFWDFSNRLQINAAKNTCNQTSSDKVPFNYILKIILNKKSEISNTNELLDAFWNKGSTESNISVLVKTSCLIENIAWWGCNTEWYANRHAGFQQ